MLEGMHFAVGPTIAARRRCLREIGGFDRLNEYLAEDFVMGKFASEAGWGVILSAYVVAHRIRWARSTRRSRPAGYVGQLFTNPIPLALFFVAAAPHLWPALLFTLALRSIAARAVAEAVLRTSPGWGLLLQQDLLSFVFWVAGFFGNTIEWRGIRYVLQPDGKFTRQTD